MVEAENRESENLSWVGNILVTASKRTLVAIGREERLRELEAYALLSPFALVEFTSFILVNDLLRFLDPISRIRRANSDQARRHLCGVAFDSCMRLLWEWLAAMSLVYLSNLKLMHLPFSLVVLFSFMPTLLWALAYRAHMNGMSTNPAEVSDFDRLQEARLNRLWTSDWSPATYFWRSIAEAQFFVFAFVPVIFTIVGRFRGDSLTPENSWIAVACRLAAAFALLAFWSAIRRTHQATARVFKEEIGALGAARRKVVSA